MLPDTNIQGQAVFVNGVPGSKCTAGTDKRFSNLCASI